MNLEEQLTAEQFYNNFVADDRFVKYILGGLKTTLLVTLFAVLLGIFLGFLVGTVRSTYERTGKLGVLNVFCRAYLSVIRGTPVTVQLMITYYLIFSSPDSSKLLCAILAFGINSGAYVAEIFRSGIMSISDCEKAADPARCGHHLRLHRLWTGGRIYIPSGGADGRSPGEKASPCVDRFPDRGGDPAGSPGS